MTNDNFEKAENALLKIIDEISTKENAVSYSDKLNATVLTLVELESKKPLISPYIPVVALKREAPVSFSATERHENNTEANNTAIGCREN